MQNLRTAHDVLSYSLQNLHDAAAQVQETLPALKQKCTHKALKNALQHYGMVTGEQLDSIQAMLRDLKAAGQVEEKACKGMEGIVDEVQVLLKEEAEPSLADTVVISSVLKIQQYKSAACQAALLFSCICDGTDYYVLLTRLLDSEKNEGSLFEELAHVICGKKPAQLEAEPVGSNSGTQPPRHTGRSEADTYDSHSTTRDILFPGGRAGISHRTYPDGESRGH